jgi:hypothetical protein
MTPFQLAQQVYEHEPCRRPFWEDFYLHLQRGIVLATPDVFMMARSVSRFTLFHYSALAYDPAHTEPDGDCWHIWLLAGDPRGVFDMFPRKDWLAWERGNVLRVWPYDTVRRLYRSRPQPAAVPA